MSKSTLSGTRIRALRLARHMTQADLARRAGVSPSYLNLIEHNRRRAAAPLLTAIAAALSIAPETLAEDAGDALVATLRSAAAMASADPPPEIDRVEELVGRFPGWAGHLAALQARIEGQTRIIERLSDRMAHDPNLSAALHEIVSAVTAVQSTAAILAETDDLEPQWRDRFHSNIHADSVRLATAAEALVAYLDHATEETGLASPQEELESWLGRHDFHLPEVEAVAAVAAGPGAGGEGPGIGEGPGAGEGASATAERLARLVEGQTELASNAARALAREWLARAVADARLLPLSRLVPVLGAALQRREGFRPERLAQAFDVSLPCLFRRLASLPQVPGLPRFGLVLCDGSGTLTFRRPIDGFALPRFGGACPVWPLYQALLQPGRPIRALIETPGRPVYRFLAHAVVAPGGEVGADARFDPPFVWEASMLLTPATPQTLALGGDALPAAMSGALPVGSSCRICPRLSCVARREPSIVAA